MNTTKNKELLLEISYKCNLNCIHCSSIGINPKCKIKIKDIAKLVNLDEIGSVRISGGEPSLVPDLLEYIKFFKDRNIKMILQTNGTDSNIWHKNIDEIWISLYGSEDIHDFITMKNIYSQVIETINALKDYTDNIVIQSPIFNDYQLWSVMRESDRLDLKLRLFALLNQGRCRFAFSIDEQKRIYHNNKETYNNVELTCSLDDKKCDYESKLVLKPDGSLFNCASHKHRMTLCKK